MDTPLPCAECMRGHSYITALSVRAVAAQDRQNSAGAVGVSMWMGGPTFPIQWPKLAKHVESIRKSMVWCLSCCWCSARQSRACSMRTALPLQQRLPLNAPQHSIRLSRTLSLHCSSEGFNPDSASSLEDKQRLVMLGAGEKSF